MGQKAMKEMAFGNGLFVVDTGHYKMTPAVFICPVNEAGSVGESARHLGHAIDCLQLGEFVMTFRTEEQAKAVADALVGI